MINKYRKYYYEKDVEWHENKIGVYHVSTIGNSHKDLEPDEHSGPCLRETYFQYVDFIPNDDKSEGNFHIGRILHGVIQDVYKHNVPNSIIEFPLVIKLTDEITIKGSVDIIDLDEMVVPDIKTSSLFTFPSSEYDYSPTHVSQTAIYCGILMISVFQKSFFKPKILRVIYTKKHNLETVEVDVDMDREDVFAAYDDFVERVNYLHDCLKTKTVPDAEPHKWCKFCPRLDYCVDNKDIIEIKKGKYVLNE